MSVDPYSALLGGLHLRAEIFTQAAYCGRWAVDTSGRQTAPFHLIQSGRCWLHVADEEPRELVAGDLVVLPHDSAHVVCSSHTAPDPSLINRTATVSRSAAECVMLCGFFGFSGHAAAPLLESLPATVVIRSGHPDTAHLTRLIFMEMDRHEFGSEAALEYLVHALFIHVLRAAVHEGFPKGVLAALGDPRLGRALAAIHEHPERAWTLDKLAARANLSRTVFSELFRSAVGQSPMRYVRQRRLQVAHDLLVGTRQPITRIAEQVGYASEVAFRQAFRRETGVTPGQARRN